MAEPLLCAPREGKGGAPPLSTEQGILNGWGVHSRHSEPGFADPPHFGADGSGAWQWSPCCPSTYIPAVSSAQREGGGGPGWPPTLRSWGGGPELYSAQAVQGPGRRRGDRGVAECERVEAGDQQGPGRSGQPPQSARPGRRGAVVGGGRLRRAGWEEAGRGAPVAPAPSRAVAAAAAAPGAALRPPPGPRPRVSAPSPGRRAPPAPEAPARSSGCRQPAGRGGAGVGGTRAAAVSRAVPAGRSRRAPREPPRCGRRRCGAAATCGTVPRRRRRRRRAVATGCSGPGTGCTSPTTA
jgi:hypothetical protein